MKLNVLLGLLILSFSLFANDKNISFSPVGRIWLYEGSDLPAVRMFFLKDGFVEFKTLDSKAAYSWLGPIGWSYSTQDQELTLSFAKAKISDLERLKEYEKKSEHGYENPKSVDLKSKNVVYRFPSRINFYGISFGETNFSQR